MIQDDRRIAAHGATLSGLSFPRRFAKTQRFTLGEPRNITISPDGTRVVFCRSRAGDDPVNCLWVYRPELDLERMVADAAWLTRDADGQLPPEERARRERAREAGGGIVSYSCDRSVITAVMALDGLLFVADLLKGTSRHLPVTGSVFDPQIDPTGNRVAYVHGNSTRIADLAGGDWELAGDDDPLVSWGSAEFVAAEEMGRQRGKWWSPDGTRLAVCRVDVSEVQVWHIADPSQPSLPPVTHRYPAAGSNNARVTLHVLGVDDDHVVQADYDFDAWPYLTSVQWVGIDRLLAVIQSRDQRDVRIIEVDANTGAVTVRHTDHDDEWVELVPGVPGELSDGRLVTCADRLGSRRLLVAGQPVTLASEQVRSVVNIGDDHVTFLSNPISDPTCQHVWRWRADGRLDELTKGNAHHQAVEGGTTVVLRSAALDRSGFETRVMQRDGSLGPALLTLAEHPNVVVRPTILRVTDHRLAAAVLLPTGHEGGPLPVLLDPYGGPHAQRVVASNHAYLTSQWFADQGFAVVVIDGRGTPGRGSVWERAVHHDLAGPVLEDQIEGLRAVAAEVPELDLSRVGIRGWSFGGYLAALAVLRRPDVFHCAIAGAPVTEWRLYDTHYTERYLGDPTTNAEAYDRSSLLEAVASLPPGEPIRPLLLIHGLADDNVVAAHTLQLSSALLAGGHHHEVLPLSGVTHMTPQEVVAENLLLYQRDFLRRSLGLTPDPLRS